MLTVLTQRSAFLSGNCDKSYQGGYGSIIRGQFRYLSREGVRQAGLNIEQGR
jgi:hypothetical protein